MMGRQTSNQSQLFYLFNLEGAHSGGSALCFVPQSDLPGEGRGILTLEFAAPIDIY
jgi:hypothetical protein